MAVGSDSLALQEAIARRARELWQARGRVDGYAKEDWFQAEAEIMERQKATTAASEKAKSEPIEPQRARLVMRVDDVLYTAEYARQNGVYKPGDFRKGQPVETRFDGEKMYVRCPNGKELETQIVGRVTTG